MQVHRIFTKSASALTLIHLSVDPNSMTTYRTVLLRFNGEPIYTGWPGVLRAGLSLEQAQAICRNPETSSTTTTSAKHLKRYGDKWFVGYEEDKPKTRNRYRQASMRAALEAMYGEN
jgi:hypothetical protein